jgi:pyrroline-5-carboxylate reductase
MPNLAVTVAAGAVAVCEDAPVPPEDVEAVVSIAETFGRVFRIPESKVDAFVSVASSSPAMLFMILESMADAAVLFGLDRASSYEIAAQAMAGSAALLLATGEHPAELKDRVCSPGGTSIEMLAELDRAGVRGAVIDAMIACYEKCKKL